MHPSTYNTHKHTHVQLMLQAGVIRQLASGLYHFLPLGLRALEKLVALIDSEMKAISGAKMAMPILTPAALWKTSGYGETNVGLASFSALCPPFSCLQYGETGRGWYLFSCDVLGNKTGNISMLGVYDSQPQLARYGFVMSHHDGSRPQFRLQDKIIHYHTGTQETGSLDQE